MIAFAELLERLVFTPARNAKIALLRRYFATQPDPDPDRGIGLAAITAELAFTAAKPGLIRELAAARTDPVLFTWSYDYVGDLAETVALMWPAAPTNAAPPRLADVVEALESAPRSALLNLVAGWLDACDPSTRFALLKLITGGLRVGASARLAKIALGGDRRRRCRRGGGSLARPRPDLADQLVFRPPMLERPPLCSSGLTLLTTVHWRAAVWPSEAAANARCATEATGVTFRSGSNAAKVRKWTTGYRRSIGRNSSSSKSVASISADIGTAWGHG